MATRIALVAAVAENGVIGRAGGMPWHLPGDLGHFQRVTTGKPIVMGRKTFEAIGRPLPRRRNIVITRQPGYAPAGVETASSLDAALALAGEADEVMVIGGGELYREALPRAARVYLTRVHASVDGDTRFPDLDPGEWRETAREERPADERHRYAFTFLTLERRGPAR